VIKQATLNFQNIAIPLLERGWAVIPLKGKIPLTKHGVKDASKDLKQIEAWAKQFPTANVGIATGKISGLVVIDVDDGPGKQGLKSLAEFTKDNPFPQTFTVKTGNGYHYYFAYPEGDIDIRNSASQLGKHMDVRGNGGYVVGPGSVHPETGSLYEIFHDHPVADIEFPLPEKTKMVKVHYQIPKNVSTTYYPDRYAAKVLQSSCDEIALAHTPEGSRNTMIYKKSFIVGCYIPQYLNENTAIDSLYQAAIRCGYVAENGEKATLNTIRSGLNDGKMNPKQLTHQDISYFQNYHSNQKPNGNGHKGQKSTPKDPDFLLTEIGFSDRLVHYYGSDLKHNKSHGWLSWDGKHWNTGAEKQVQEYAKHLAKKLFEEALNLSNEINELNNKAIEQESTGHDSSFYKDKVKILTKRCKELRLHAFSMNKGSSINSVTKLASSDPVIAKDASEFNSDDWLLNVKNGTLNLKTGELQNHKREDLITEYIDIPYDRDATCPLWDDFLSYIMGGNQELIQYLYRALGYSLIGGNSEQALFICYGDGKNGKSVFLGAMQNIMGSYGRESHPDTLMVNNRNNSNGASDDLARLAGARFISVNETKEGHRFDEPKIKSMTGGDKLVARNLYKDSFEFEMKAKIWIRTNHHPEFRGEDIGIKRRMRKIPFLVNVPPEKRDIELPDKLKSEYPGILNRIVQGCLEWQITRLNEPQIVLEATQEYLDQMDIIGQFFSHLFPDGQLTEQKASEMFEFFSSWATLTGRPSLSQTRFGKTLNQRGWTTQKKHGTIWRIPPDNGGQFNNCLPVGTVFYDNSQTVPNLQPSMFENDVGDSGDSYSQKVPIEIENSIYITPVPTIPTIPQEKEENVLNDYITSSSGIWGQFDKNGDSWLRDTEKKEKKTHFLNEAKAFVNRYFSDGNQYELVQLCKRGGLGDSYPAVRKIQQDDYTSDNWAIRVYSLYLKELGEL